MLLCLQVGLLRVHIGINILYFLASCNVHLVLADDARDLASSYQITLGGHSNQRSWISRGEERLVTAATAGILSDEEFRAFWVTWTDGNIQVGKGKIVNLESRYMQWRQPQQEEHKEITYIGISTSDGSLGEFKLWHKEGKKN